MQDCVQLVSKADPAIQLDLPDKYEQKVFFALSAEQGAFYEHVVQDLFVQKFSRTGGAGGTAL
jgi:SNF2 family DNA or RNA helicase